MFQNLTKNEKIALNYLKEDFERTHSISLGHIYPKFNFPKDTIESLQSKGYLEINRTNFEHNHEFVTIILKDNFFKYFNININQ